MCADLSV